MYRKVYFMGIKGVGMATLAVMAKQAGMVVGGSDVAEEFITDEILRREGITPYVGFDEDNVDDFLAGLPVSEVLFIATGAHDGFDNPEVIYAVKKDIKVITHGEAVGLFMSGAIFGRDDIFGISVAGSHGKTTITSLLASALVALGQDPSYTAGTSEIVPIGAAGHYGSGKYFVAEADEYVSEKNADRRPKFFHQRPKALILNNIDFDHPDFYRDIDHVERVFSEYILDLPEDTILVFNRDDVRVRNILSKVANKARVITYGSGPDNDYIVSSFKQMGMSGEFSVTSKGMDIGKFSLSIPGFYNAKNSLSVIALLMEVGFSAPSIAEALPRFRGGKRRLEAVGKSRAGQLIFDDYAHHPEEIRKTIAAVKEAYPDKKLLTIFQAHTFSRTKSMEKEFVSALSTSDKLIILKTFASLRHDTDEGNYDETFTQKFDQINKEVLLFGDQDSVVEYIQSDLKDPNLIILTMGAGDVYKIAYSLRE